MASYAEADTINLVCQSRGGVITVFIDAVSKYIRVNDRALTLEYKDGANEQYVTIGNDTIKFGEKTGFKFLIDRRTGIWSGPNGEDPVQCSLAPSTRQF
jgi:hypothetical protein